ncbi:MAG TPA: hypothetical protein VIF43_03105 [Patescibacteria group bacterium]
MHPNKEASMGTVVAIATLPFRLVGMSWERGEARIKGVIDWLEYETSYTRRHPHLDPRRR